MLRSDSVNNKPSDVEQRLGDILKLLNPPQQQYDVLAARASGLLPYLPRPSIERTLARYFELFAAGYDIWQGSYDYPRIHEYFYGAYLQAVQEGYSCLSSQLTAMLEQMTHALIAYTDCENALICNDPKGLFDSAKRATGCGIAALKSLAYSSLKPPLRDPIKQYLQMNINLWSGFKRCAEMYLAPLKNETIPDAVLNKANKKLKSLEAKSRELTSELRAHFSFAQRLAQAHVQRSSDLRVKEGMLLLRASGYVGEDVTAKLFEQFENTDTMPEEKRKNVCEKTGLRFLSIRSASIDDIYKTSLGQKYLEQIIFELSTEDNKHALAFTIRDGERELVYPVEKFQVRLAHFGTISVEFEISIEDASVSHVRVLNSLIAPYAGRFAFVWREAPQDIGQESTNYVECFLMSQKWIKSIRDAMQNELSLTVAAMESVCEKWQQTLCELAACLRPDLTEPLHGTAGHAELSGHDPKACKEQAEPLTKRVYKTLHEECFLVMRKLAQRWIKNFSTKYPALAREGESIFPAGVDSEHIGVRYGHLMDIADEVLKHIIKYFDSEVQGFKIQRLFSEEVADVERLSSGKDVDVRRLFSFDRDTGWASILLCTRLIIDERSGTSIEPMTESDYYRVAAHPEFKGFIIQPREARSGLFDWLFVAMPEYQNLATIRSHKTDAMYIGENHAFLYLPDDPQFLTDQYIETVRLMDDIRTLVRSFNPIAKAQIEDLEEDFKKMRGSKSYQIPGMSLSGSYDYLSSRREKIEDFRTHAEKILDLIRSTTISRYQDHSELLMEMIKESRVDNIRKSLEHNMADLDRFHAYLSERLKRRIDERSESNQNVITWLILVLTLLIALSAIPVLFSFLADNHILDAVIGRDALLKIAEGLLVAILLGSIVAGLITWQRSRK